MTDSYFYLLVNHSAAQQIFLTLHGNPAYYFTLITNFLRGQQEKKYSFRNYIAGHIPK